MRALQRGVGLICESFSGPKRHFRGDLFEEVVGLPTLCSHAGYTGTEPARTEVWNPGLILRVQGLGGALFNDPLAMGVGAVQI